MLLHGNTSAASSKTYDSPRAVTLSPDLIYIYYLDLINVLHAAVDCYLPVASSTLCLSSLLPSSLSFFPLPSRAIYSIFQPCHCFVPFVSSLSWKSLYFESQSLLYSPDWDECTPCTYSAIDSNNSPIVVLINTTKRNEKWESDSQN